MDRILRERRNIGRRATEVNSALTLTGFKPDGSQTVREAAVKGAWVPSPWRLEVASGLRTGLRQGRIDLADRDAALVDMGMLRITVDLETDVHAWTTTLRLADRFGLTAYDAAYLELALRRSLPLASLYGQLCDAARSVSVPVIGD